MIVAENWTLPFDRSINQLLFSVCSSCRSSHARCGRWKRRLLARPHAVGTASWQSGVYTCDAELLTTGSVRHIKHLCRGPSREPERGRRLRGSWGPRWWTVKDTEVIRGAWSLNVTHRRSVDTEQWMPLCFSSRGPASPCRSAAVSSIVYRRV